MNRESIMFPFVLTYGLCATYLNETHFGRTSHGFYVTFFLIHIHHARKSRCTNCKKATFEHSLAANFELGQTNCVWTKLCSTQMFKAKWNFIVINDIRIIRVTCRHFISKAILQYKIYSTKDYLIVYLKIGLLHEIFSELQSQ